MIKKPLIVLTGPTAVGKTKLSIELAKAVNAEIISADSMQVYKGMDIGTAKINAQEMEGIKHHLIDCLEPYEEFNVVLFQKMAKAAMEEIYAKGKIPIIVGGTGFYIQALLYDIDFEADNKDESVDTGYRKYLYALAEEKGNEFVHNMLKEVDEAAAKAIHMNNTKRVIRALEYYKQTGNKISEHNETQSAKKSPYNYLYFVLNDDREVLYKRIDRRVDMMFEAGLVAEMEKLVKAGLTKDMVSMQGIGYKELFGLFTGEYDEERAKYLIKLDTRHFAKRQLTWFRRESDVNWINYKDFNNSADDMLNYMMDRSKGIGII